MVPESNPGGLESTQNSGRTAHFVSGQSQPFTQKEGGNVLHLTQSLVPRKHSISLENCVLWPAGLYQGLANSEAKRSS